MITLKYKLSDGKNKYLGVTESKVTTKIKSLSLDNIFDDSFVSFCIIHSPSGYTRFSKEFDCYGLDNSTRINEFLNILIKKIGVPHVFFFGQYSSEKEEFINLKEQFDNEYNECFYLYTGDAAIKTMYLSLRNIVAHGNVLFDGNYYYFYASRKEENNGDNKKIRFFLKVKNYKKIKCFQTCLIDYAKKLTKDN